MIPIDRTEIEAWGRLFDAKGNFPKLISKLIRETTPKSTILQIPSGSAVNMGGWDGVVRCSEDTGYVPAGISLWEIGTNGNVTKANKDYIKRSSDSLGFDKSEACFVFITTNVWVNKNVWVKEKKQDKIWRDVKVYDSIDIAEWLENAQISSRWFSILTKDHPYDGIYNAEEYWRMLSIGPNGQLPPTIVTAGREKESKALLEFLKGEPNLKAIKASTKEEAIAFIIASAMLFENHPGELFFSRSVVVDEEHKFHGLRINKNAINMIAKLDITGKLWVAAHDNGHHVLVPLGPDDSFGSQDILELPRIDRDGQVDALKEMGLTHAEATKYSKEAGRDYTILKSLLGFTLNETKWKYQDEISEIVPALLVGRWNEDVEGDRKVLENLSGENYKEYSEKLLKWLEVESPPLIRIGNSWRLTSPLDAWTNLSKFLSYNDFEKLNGSFLEVMKEINPIFELSPEDRPMASLRGKSPAYSSWCREGLTQSMILIGLHGDRLKFQHRFPAQEWVDEIIKELLYDASGNLWASRNNEMPLIAEASPKSFFESAYHSLSLDDKPIMDMFQEEDGIVSSNSHHTGLLWALEGLAWTEEYVYDASIILARLARLDPGGKLINRPINSLKEIYKPWFCQTLASFEVRMKILEQILIKEFDIGWSLLISMIPDSTGSAAFPTHKLRWRLFERSFEPKSNWPEVFTTHSRVLDLLIKYYDFSEGRLIDLIKGSLSDQIQSKDREKVLVFVDSNLDKVKITDNTIWNDLRGIISRHRSHPDARWALSENELKSYETIYQRLEPPNSIERVVWMFNDAWPNFPEGTEKESLSYEEQEKLITKRRIEGLQGIYQEFGFKEVQELVKSVKETLIYGDTLAYIVNTEDEILELCEYFKDERSHVRIFIQRFIYRKSIIEDVEWVFELYEKLNDSKFTDCQLANIFLQIEQTRKVWKFIDGTPEETQRCYWKGIHPHFWGAPEDDLIYGLNKLMEVNRFISALEIIYRQPEKIPTPILVEVLESAGTKDSDEDRRLDSFHATKIIEILENREELDKSVLLRIEWIYLPFLASYSSIQKPRVLHDELASNPVFFIDVLSLVYKSEKEEESDIAGDEIKQARAANAYQLLRSWEKVPGVGDDESLDEDLLWSWINKVRDLAKASGRLSVADIQIGKILAEYPERVEPWPPKEICKVIETINTDSLKSGFSTGTFNKRGASTRGAFDGGEIERGHAKYFNRLAEAIKFEFPETSKVLAQLAKGYERDAKIMDESAERDKLDN